MPITNVHINWPYHNGTTELLEAANIAVESVSLTIFCKEDDWKTQVFSSIQSSPNLRRLNIQSAGYPSLSLPVSTVTETLSASCNTLEHLTIHGIGFTCDDASSDFDDLKIQCRVMKKLDSVSITDMYFGHHRFRDGREQQQLSWMQCCRFCDALASIPVATQIQLSAIQIRYSRPALTLASLHAMLCHPCLQNLSLQHFTIWGGGSALDCAMALRCNGRLSKLHFQHVVFATDESVLQGISDNRTLEHLSLLHCMLHLQEAAALKDSLCRNSHLRMLNLRGAILGVDSLTHDTNLKSCIAAVTAHKSLQALDVRCCSNSVEIVQQAVEELVKQNRVLTDIEMNHNNATVEYRLGLNRAKFWQLKQDRIAEWITALGLTKSNTSCLFTMLRENPVMFRA